MARQRVLRLAGWAAVAVVALAVVPALSTFYVSSAGQILAFAIAAMGASLMIEHCNLPSIGHGAFFGIAAYAVGLLTLHEVTGGLAGVLLAVLVTTAFAAVAGLVVLRTRAAYFMMITLAISQLLSGLAASLTSFTGGDNGLTGLPSASLASLDLADPLTFYFTCLVVLVAVALVIKLLIDSPYGYALRSLKYDDLRPRSLGVGTLRVTLVAFVLSGAITGLGGALYTLNAGYADPSILSATTSGAIFLMVALAGRLGVFGPIAGAIVVEGIVTIVGSHTTHSQLVLGLVSAAAALFLLRSRPGPAAVTTHGAAPARATEQRVQEADVHA